MTLRPFIHRLLTALEVTAAYAYRGAVLPLGRRAWRLPLVRGIAENPLLRPAVLVACMLGVAWIVVSGTSVAALRWIPPITSAFMLSHAGEVAYDWVPREQIADDLRTAVLASEDQRFYEHRGFDVDSITDAFADYLGGDKLRGASTISQQTAKNLYLWNGRSLFRKLLEAYFTILVEALWPKKRILEVYLNIAEFGPGIYGAEAASRHFFDKPASELRRHEAARLAAVLPNPKRMRANPPSAYVRKRSSDILRQMRMMSVPARRP